MSDQCSCLPYQDGGLCPSCLDDRKISKLSAYIEQLEKAVEAARAVSAMDHGDACCEDYENDCAKLDALEAALATLDAFRAKEKG